MNKIISNFSGKFDFLSNFYSVPVYYNRMMFKTTEAAFQAAKTFNLKDKTLIADAVTPSIAKQLGRRVSLRPDWEEIKDAVMLDILRLKFTKGSYLAEQLEATGDCILVEGTTWHDQYWGICKCQNHHGEGRNLLGQILMRIRDENRGKTNFSSFSHEFRQDWLTGGPFTLEHD